LQDNANLAIRDHDGLYLIHWTDAAHCSKRAPDAQVVYHSRDTRSTSVHGQRIDQSWKRRTAATNWSDGTSPASESVAVSSPCLARGLKQVA